MINNFDDAFAVLTDANHEGTYSNDPNDPGGETMYGVTERVARGHGYMGAMKDLPLASAKIIAKQGYWDVAKCDRMPPMIAFQVFDAVYNHGLVNPSMWLQAAVGAVQDGVIGDMTLAAVNSHPLNSILFNFLASRLNFYTNLNGWSNDGRGWSHRMSANMKIAGAQS